MSNRGYLYLVNPDVEDGLTEIAEAKYDLPGLWQLLLADARPAAAIDDQRVFGDAGTANIASPAKAALHRLEAFKAWLRYHPRFDEVPALDMHMDAVLSHLWQLVAAAEGPSEPMFSASIDEFAWMSADAPGVFIADTLERGRSRWEAIQRRITEMRFDDFDTLVGFRQSGVDFADWRAWSAVFGMASLSHRYFAMAWDEPRTMAFEDFDEEDEAEGDDTWLGANRERFREGALWGVRTLDGDDAAGEVVTAAQWQKIRPADHPPDEHNAESLDDTEWRCWVQRDGRYALMVLAGPQAGMLLTEHAFDEVWGFHEGLAIVQHQGRMGYLRRDGQWHLAPAWDEVWDFEYGLATVRVGGLHGYIGHDGRYVFEPRFTDTRTFIAEGTSIAGEGASWSVLRRDGTVVVAGCSNIEWRDELRGWVITQAGLQGLFHADGSPWLPVVFERIRSLGVLEPILVRREGQDRLHAWSGEELPGCRYPALAPITPARGSDGYGAEHGAGLFVATDAAGQLGLIDASGRVLVPFEFDTIDLFDAQHGPRAKVENRRQLRVGRQRADTGLAAYGIWDVAQVRLVLPCVYDHVWLVMISPRDSHGFVVAHETIGAHAKEVGKYALSLLDDEALPMFPQAFAWIGVKCNLDQHDAMDKIREAIYLPWATGRPVPAALTRKAAPLQLKRDGTWR